MEFEDDAFVLSARPHGESGAIVEFLTAGRGRYAMDFSHYEPVPAQVQQKLVEDFKPHHDED